MEYALLAIAASLDNFALSAFISGKREASHKAWLVILVFTAFHVLLPFLGSLLDQHVLYVVSQVDHWIAFGVLLYLGLKAIFGDSEDIKSLTLSGIIALGLVSSMDALFLGITIDDLGLNMITFMLVLGAMALLASSAGFFLGRMMPKKVLQLLPKLSGLLLIGFGVVLLVSHIMDHQS